MDFKKRSYLLTVGLLLAAISARTLIAQTAPPLGTAQTFAVLGATTVTNAGGSVLTGDLGVSPGSAITGFPPGVLTGTIHAADAIAAQAQADAHTAYNFLAGETCTTNLSGTDLGGLTLLPGVYCFNTTAQLTGTLTLNATGNPNAVFVFKIGSAFSTASNSAVVIQGGSPCNIFFQVGSSATLGTGTKLLGSIFAQASITETTGSSVTGSTYALSGAVTLDSNAVTACSGTIKVCKVAGNGVTPGTNFSFSVAGTPLIVPAGLAPGGSCSQPLIVPAHPVAITETIPAGTTLSGVSTLPDPALLISSNLGAGTATVAVNPGGQTIATFIDTIPPIIPTTGFLQICKVAGSGVLPGTLFTFNAAGTLVTVAAGPAPNGTCAPAIQVPAGQSLIAETLPAGTTLTAVSTLPNAGLLVASNLAAGTATVTVNAGGQTIATFTDTVIPTTGLLQICKVAGTGIVAGTNFTFSVGGNPVIVQAGPAPTGTCSPAIVTPAGPVAITEMVPGGTALTSVSTAPSAGLLISSNLAAGTASVSVVAGGQTTVTFLNTLIPIIPTTGVLQICKVAGSGISVGTNFTFNVGGSPITVAAGPAPGGTCSLPIVVQAGNTVVSEMVPAGIALTSVTTLPGGALVSSNLSTGVATVSVTAGGQTIATFLDTLIPIIPTTGLIQVCKVAGAGVALGTNFSFNVAGTLVTVQAGPAPGGTCSVPMVVQGGPVVISETVPAGTALTSVSTLPAGALVSSNLATGAATVTVAAGGQTVATFLNTIIPIIPTTGFLQVCKIAGSGVAVGTPFTFNVGGTAVIVLAGAAPGGSCSQPIVVPAGTVVINETLPAGTSLTAVSTMPSGLLVSSNLAAGTATVTVTAGGQTIASFLNTIIPIIPTTGLLQICKVAGPGVAVGTNFTFTVGGVAVVVPAGPAPGSCSPSLVVPIGQVLIAEILPSGGVLTDISTLPTAALLVSSNLASGTATVTVNAVGQTTATFTNAVIPTTGFLQICKIAGAGVAAGTPFLFDVAGTPVTVLAGPAPGGTCSAPIQVQAGQKVITETVPTGTALTSVITLPAVSLVSSNLGAGIATVTVNAGGQTIATFLNTLIPVIPTTGLLQICKIAGSGVTVGTNFTFNAGGTVVTVPAGAAPGGSCGQPMVVPAGQTLIAETLPPGTTLTSVSTLPAGLVLGSNLAGGTATVTVNAGGQTIVTFLNTVIPVIPATGFLQICKIAGAGVSVGTNFMFDVAGTPVTVQAGPAPGGSCSQPLVVLAGPTLITETLPSGIALTSVSTLPSGLLVSSSLGAGTATVTVNAGGQTIATFLNTIIPIIPMTGSLQICKAAGSGITVGTNFQFNVGGAEITVPAGPAPGGSCSQPIQLPIGPALISEMLPPGIALTSVSALPAGSLTNSNLGTGTATVTITSGGQITATFLNTLIPTTGFLQICKVAGNGVTVGTNFLFNIAGAVITVPAGPAPGGSCSQPIQLPTGPSLITENLPTGIALTSVSVLPAGLLVNSNLGTGAATVTINTGVQTTATFLNTLIPTTGFLQICKVAGNGVAQGTNFTFNVGGSVITVPAGPAPNGTCSQPIQLPTGPAPITETLPTGIALTSVSVLPAGSLVNSNLGTGAATVTINTGVQTTATFLNTLIQTNGFLQICKVAGNGVTLGTPFTFAVGTSVVTVPAGPAPNGTCSQPIQLPTGQAVVTETPQTGSTVTAIIAAPSARLLAADLAGQKATVSIVTGDISTASIVTFTNGATFGLLKICKVAGAGVTVGAQFNFTVGTSTVTVPAGYCAKAGLFPVGTQLTATEMIPSGFQLSDISVLPASRALTAPNLTSGSVSFTVGDGETEVVFTNIQTVDMGQLRVCKIAGTGVASGTNFTFTAAGGSLTVAAGSCALAATLPVGTSVTVSEAASAGTILSAIGVLPANRLSSLNLAGRSVTATIGTGVTEVDFTNTVPVITGQLRVCKIGGAGIAPGTNFTFAMSGTGLTVPAGSCVLAATLPVGTSVTVSESASAGTILSAIGVLPVDRLGSLDLAGRSVTATIGTGVTELDFTNIAPVITGQLNVCKIAGTGVVAGTNFTFTVAGTPLTVPAGSCVLAATLPVGTSVSVSEAASAGTILSAIGVLPVDRLGTVNLSGRSVTATIGTGVTEVDFTNTAPVATGQLTVCKIAGAGIVPGTNFTFAVSGSTLTVPAGSCVMAATLPVGTSVTVSEAASTGTVLSMIGVLPVDRLGSVNLAGRSVTATIGSGVTELDFTNIAPVVTGQLSVCKIAGTGIAPGTNFTFAVGGTNVIVPAGSCVLAATLPVGTSVTVSEAVSAGTTLSAIGVVPVDRLGSVNLAGRSVTATMGTGVTEVDFTNTAPPATGQLRVCKIGGTGIAAGTNFTFTVAGTSLTVPAGSCVLAATLPVGTSVTISEATSAGAILSAIDVIPADRLGSVNLAGRLVTAIVGTGVTEVDFTNTGAGTGLLKVCKINGAGVALGTNFSFAINGATFMVPAGFCVKQGLLPVGTIVTITELPDPATVLSTISVLPADRQGVVDLPGRTITATVGDGATEVYFTNAAKTP